ncbi:MAG: MFS transporter [Actinobacteria bacterium]|nr:MFS transporter [Actinomycetota bacterium]
MTYEAHHVDAGPALSRDLALATWGLFVGLALLLLAGGLFGTLLGVRSETAGLPTAITGLIAASYYLGFVVGSRLTLRALGAVGHIRVYAALAALLTTAMLGVGLTDSWVPWALLRLVTGLCFAGQYVVAESWLNDLATNANRGRLLAIYNVISTGAFAVGQAVVFAFDAEVVTGFALCAIAASLAVIPVTLSEEAVAPKIEESEHITLKQLAEVVPTGLGACFLVGIAHGAIGGLPAVYATRVGMPAGWVGLFAAAPSLGGVLLQWPISAASDDLDRRVVGFAGAVGAMGTAALLVLTPETHWMVLVWFALLGGLSYPLYSIAGAYTNDWIEPEHLNAAASQLVTLYGVGAVLGPFVAAGLMIGVGPGGFFWALIILHGMIAAFLAYRIKAWRSPLTKRPWDEVSLPARAFYVPATIVAAGRRRRRRPDAES